MRRSIQGPLLAALVALAGAPALASPVLAEDTRDISVFAQASDSLGDGPPVGPVVISRSAPGAFFAEQRAVSANAPGFGVNAIAGGIQFSQFHDGPGVHFEADGSAEVQVDMLDPFGSAQAVSAVGVRLVFELSQDTPYDLTGELTMFAIGAVASDVRVALSAAGGGAPWFEQTLAGAFHTRGVLEEGTWVLEISADAYADPRIDPLESSNAVATFRGVHFVLVPAPGPVALLALAGTWAHRRRRDRGVVCSGRGPADPPHLDEAHPGRVPGEHRPLL